jgi:hypothetical protein
MHSCNDFSWPSSCSAPDYASKFDWTYVYVYLHHYHLYSAFLLLSMYINAVSFPVLQCKQNAQQSSFNLRSGGAFDIPGAARPAEFAGNDFLREFEQQEGLSDQYQHFDNIFEQGRQHGAAPGPGFRPPDGHETQLIEPCLQVGIGVFGLCSKHA